MAIEKNKRFGLPQRLIGLLALICFMGMFAFSPVLHARELDLKNTQDDCAPCHWAQNHSCDKISNNCNFSIQAFNHLPLENISYLPNIISSHFSIRAPPHVL